MKEVTVRVAGQEIPLYYNGYAMYAVRDLLGEEKIYDVLAQDTPEAFEKTCEIASILATQGELYRRYIGMDKGRILSAQVLRLILRPADMVALRKAIMDAFVAGMQAEQPEDADVDIGLQELDAKKSKKKG